MSRWRSRPERYGRTSVGASAVPLRPRADAGRALGLWRAGPVAGHGLRLRRLRLRGVSRATRSRIVFARPGAIAVLRSASVYSFAAAAPVVRRYARALRPRIAPPWSASALASQRVRPHLSTVKCRRTVPSSPRGAAGAYTRGCRISHRARRCAVKRAVLRTSGRVPRQISRRETGLFGPPPIYATASRECGSDVSASGRTAITRQR